MEDANVLAESKKLPLDRSSKQDTRRRRAHIVIGGGAVALDEEIKQMIARGCGCPCYSLWTIFRRHVCRKTTAQQSGPLGLAQPVLIGERGSFGPVRHT